MELHRESLPGRRASHGSAKRNPFFLQVKLQVKLRTHFERVLLIFDKYTSGSLTSVSNRRQRERRWQNDGPRKDSVTTARVQGDKLPQCNRGMNQRKGNEK